MKRLLSTLFLALLFIGSINAQLLYKITGKGIEKPSYIVGTYHIAPASFVDSIPGARAALENVEQVCGEVVMSEMASPANVKKVQEAMMLPDGKSIEDIFEADEMARINAYIKSILGTDFTNPMIKSTMGKMTPTAIETQLQVIMCMKHTPGFNPNALIDSYFQTEGAKMGKNIKGFETVDFQIEVLYTGTPIERQKQKLLCAADNSEYMLTTMQNISKAYFSQDMEAIKAVADEKMGEGCNSTPEEEEALIYGRNANWVQVMPDMMAASPTLFVVGALHLPGERGVIKMLQKEGYTVEAVK